MKRTRKQPEPMRVVRHYGVTKDGDIIDIDPSQTDLPDRCKLALAEMTTGQPHTLVAQHRSP